MSDILLDTLKQGLDAESVKYLEADPQLRQASELYLQELLINDDLLSTEVFTTNSSSAMTPSVSTATESTESNGNGDNKNNKVTLTEEIAELDRQQREINVQLASITNENRELIIDISNDLHNINDKIDSDYNKEIDAMLKVLDIQTSGMANNHINKFQININEKLTNAIKINNSILSNIDSVLDLLELPTLCKLCILQGNYQESLEISMLTQALIIRFPKLVIFQKIQNQVEQELRLMVKGLIKLLNTNLKQNNILKIFQILNKLDIINSTSSSSPSNLTFSTKSINSANKQQQKDKLLKIIFLNARYKFITDEISNLKPLIKFNKLTYLKRFIEVYREFIFNSLSMYYAIFSSTTSSSSTTASSASLHTSPSLNHSSSQSSLNAPSLSSSSHNGSEEDNLLINQFIRSLANQLSDSLITYLPEIIHTHSENDFDNDIDSQGQKDGLILQIIYLCKSLSKFNADFESIIRWELCYVDDPLITENDWIRNLAKVKKFRY